MHINGIDSEPILATKTKDGCITLVSSWLIGRVEDCAYHGCKNKSDVIQSAGAGYCKDHCIHAGIIWDKLVKYVDKNQEGKR